MEKMKRQKDENSKRLIEMSGLVKSLQAIPVNYEKNPKGNNFMNVQRKIEAIMEEMDEAKKRYDELRNEKYFQHDTIRAQELQIKSMEQQILLLNERLQREENEQKEKQKQQQEKQEAKTRELEEQVMLQEMEMMNLRAEIDELERENALSLALGKEIKLHEASNAAKYAEIQTMEEKLRSMRMEQDAQKSRQADIVSKNTKEQSEFVITPTATIVAEINKLKDDVGNLRLAQAKKTALESSENLKILPSAQKPNSANTKSKSQPWNRDLQWQDTLNHKKTELDVVTNNDVKYEEPANSESNNNNQNSLSLPSLESKKRVVKSVRKKRSVFASERSVSSSSENSHSLESIVEENEDESDEIKQSKSCSDTSATVTGESSTTDLSQTSKDPEKSKNLVEVVQSDDGSVECVSYTRPELKPSLSHSSDDKTADSSELSRSGSTSNDEYSHEESSRDESSNENSSGIYSTESSAESSSRSILEQIPEEIEGESDCSNSEAVENETNESASEWDGEKSVGNQETTDQENASLKDQQVGSLLLRKQLKESETKYNKVMSDYNQLVAKSQIRADKLEEENRKLREGQAKALNNMAKECEDESKLRWVKQENKMLLKSMEKQNQLLAKQNKDYERLQNEHSDTLSKLEEKKKRYDQLILDFSNLAGNGKSTQDYNRLKALHDSVAMKLADMSEDNEKLEKERDEAIDQLENKNIQIRAYDESIAALNKTEYDLKNLEDVHKETVVELQQLRDKNKELSELYEKNSTNVAYSEQMQEDYIKAMAEIDVLVASNKDFEGIDKKLNASEVKVTMLEEELKKNHEKLLATKKKSNDRAGQLREVIAQYKTLQTEHSEKCAKLTRLEVAMEGLENDQAIKGMQTMEQDLERAKQDVSEAIAGKDARENDLKIVLEHYEKLQRKYEKLKGEVKSTGKPQEEKKEDPECMVEEEKQRESISNLEKLLKQSKESMGWKDEKIAKTLTELKEAKQELETIQNERKELEVELSEMKSNVLLARKEAENAEGRQNNGQDQLRTAVAKHHQLQQVYDSLLKKFGDTTSELQKAKNDIKVKEQEEKHARKRAATVHSQYKKLQADHGVVVQRLEKLKVEMNINKEITEF